MLRGCFSRLLFATLLVNTSLFSCFPCAAQTRDASAIALAKKSVDTLGGHTSLTSVQDVKATGTITFYVGGAQSKGPVTLRARGGHQFRLDSQISGQMRTVLVNNGHGFRKSEDGKVIGISTSDAANLIAFGAPTWVLDNALQDTSISITPEKSAEPGGAQRIRIQKTHLKSTDIPDLYCQLGVIEVSIDYTTFQITAVRDRLHPHDRAAEEYLRELRYSDYRTVNGMFMPFSITEYIMGQRTLTITLDSITFNSSLSDSDFQM